MINMALRVGRATKDPILRYSTHGDTATAFANFSIATERNYKDKTGKKITDFLEITVRGPLAEHCANYIQKGKLVGVCGPIYDKEYIKDGITIRSKYIDVIQVQFLEYDSKGNQDKEDIHTEEDIESYDLTGYSNFDSKDFC